MAYSTPLTVREYTDRSLNLLRKPAKMRCSMRALPRARQGRDTHPCLTEQVEPSMYIHVPRVLRHAQEIARVVAKEITPGNGLLQGRESSCATPGMGDEGDVRALGRHSGRTRPLYRLYEL